MKAVIIEDEKAAVRNLTALLSDVAPEIEVIAKLESITETLEWFRVHPTPSLVFLDIHLADGSAFEIFKHITIECPVIFTTAYDEYALKAFKVNSVDYLLKPIGKEDTCHALDKLRKLQAGNGEEQNIHQLVNLLKSVKNYKTHFLIPVKGDKLLPLATDSILYFMIDNSVVKAVTEKGDEYLFSQTLDELGEALDPQYFFRANRQYIISRKSIKDVDLWFNNRLSLNLVVNTPEKILISKMRVPDFKNWFAG